MRPPALPLRYQPLTCGCARHGITLIEMLVSLAITLIMMAAVVSVFGLMGDSVSSSRATIEQSERLRHVRNVLQADLAGITVTMDPPRKPENDEGYFEYNEDVQTDQPGSRASIMGDTDDVLCFTVRSNGEPFIGRNGGSTLQSQTAEVVWFVADDNRGAIIDATTSPPTRALTLYRRVLLVSPSVGTFANQTTHDISGRPVSGNFEPNTLGDLTKRENRFNRNTAFPFTLKRLKGFNQASGRLGEDVILTNVLAFDVQVFDTGVPLKHIPPDTTALLPSDAGYSNSSAVAFTPALSGGYVDLGYSAAAGSQFSGAPASGSKITARPYVYDTWSKHYEQNGQNEDGDSTDDEGTNGLDDDNDGVVDDADEMETAPPYNVKLRGLRIRIRVYEPDSRQVREVSVVHDFLPE